MLWILQAVSDRLRAMFATDVALGFEAEIATRQAARKAELLRQAQRYDAEGLAGVAAELRERAGCLSLERPLASALPGIDELRQPLPPLLLAGQSLASGPTSGLAGQHQALGPAASKAAALVPTVSNPKRRKPR